jgi:drug/metabolite transporter (DMT)-like permease
MQSLTTRQWVILALLTVVWGLNWPIMKLGVTGFPPLTFRLMCLLIGTPVLGLALLAMKVPFRIPRQYWRELLVLAIFNMFIWHALIILAVQYLTSGRSAILGYTMPIFSALIGAFVFQNQLSKRAWGGVAAAALGVVLLLWHELANLSGKPVGVLLALAAASTWAAHKFLCPP